jgi:hypothetical protein
MELLFSRALAEQHKSKRELKGEKIVRRDPGKDGVNARLKEKRKEQE